MLIGVKGKVLPPPMQLELSSTNKSHQPLPGTIPLPSSVQQVFDGDIEDAIQHWRGLKKQMLIEMSGKQQPFQENKG